MEGNSDLYHINGYDSNEFKQGNVIFSLKANQFFCDALEKIHKGNEGNSIQPEIEFLNANEAAIYIGETKFVLNISQIEHTECFSQNSEGGLDFEGMSQGRLAIVSSNEDIAAVLRNPPEAPTKKCSAPSLSKLPAPPLPMPPSKSLRKEQGKKTAPPSASSKATHPSASTSTISISSLPLYVAAKDILRFFSGLKLKAILFTLDNNLGLAFVTLESISGAELALLRSGEFLMYIHPLQGVQRIAVTISSIPPFEQYYAQTVGLPVDAVQDNLRFSDIADVIRRDCESLLQVFSPSPQELVRACEQKLQSYQVYDLPASSQICADMIRKAYDLDAIRSLSDSLLSSPSPSSALPSFSALLSPCSLSSTLSSLRPILTFFYHLNADLHFLTLSKDGQGAAGREDKRLLLLQALGQMVLRVTRFYESYYCALRKMHIQHMDISLGQT